MGVGEGEIEIEIEIEHEHEHEHYKPLGASVSLGRLGEPAEVAPVIVFLASGLASCMTGACINVDGGSSGVF